MANNQTKNDDTQKGWLDKLYDKVGLQRKPKPQNFDEISIADNMIRALQDKKLGERIEATDIILTLLEEGIPKDANNTEKLDKLQLILDTFNRMIQMIAAPYARSGDYPRYSKMMHGWNTIYGIDSSMTNQVRTHFTENDDTQNQNTTMDNTDKVLSDNTLVIDNLIITLIQYDFPDAFDVLGYCYKDQDVRPQAVTVITSMMPQMMGMGPQPQNLPPRPLGQPYQPHPDQPYNPNSGRDQNGK